jgi:steroid delta-isomerase-like uncharacterized protein
MSIEGNKTIAREFFMEQDRRKGPLSPDLVAADYTARIAGNPPMTHEGHSAFGAAFYAGFPDLYHTIDEVIADENSAVVRFTLRGTHTSDFMGIPATGKPIEVTAIAIQHIADGKVTSLRAEFDQAGMLRQLGVIPS